jgi:hypothetical protein
MPDELFRGKSLPPHPYLYTPISCPYANIKTGPVLGKQVNFEWLISNRVEYLVETGLLAIAHCMDGRAD